MWALTLVKDCYIYYLVLPLCLIFKDTNNTTIVAHSLVYNVESFKDIGHYDPKTLMILSQGSNNKILSDMTV